MNLHLSVTTERSHAPIVKFPRDIQRIDNAGVDWRFDLICTQLSSADAPARKIRDKWSYY